MIKKFIKNINEKTILTYTFILSFVLLKTNLAFATDLASSPIVKGTLDLIKDGTLVLIGASSGIAVFMIIVYQIKKGMCGDEMEAKQYDKKTKAVLFAYIIILCASSIMAIITHYYPTGSAV